MHNGDALETFLERYIHSRLVMTIEMNVVLVVVVVVVYRLYVPHEHLGRDTCSLEHLERDLRI